jgi:hypothetical protein
VRWAGYEAELFGYHMYRRFLPKMKETAASLGLKFSFLVEEIMEGRIIFGKKGKGGNSG